jgi:DNA-binding NarL/FixJ family response regulator
MTGDKNANHILTAYKLGASGFVYKPFYLRELSEVITQIVDFGCYMPPLIASTLIKLISEKTVNVSLQEKYSLTNRELEIIELMNKGYSYKEMAMKLGVSVHAINYHTKNIYFKMDVNSQAKFDGIAHYL